MTIGKLVQPSAPEPRSMSSLVDLSKMDERQRAAIWSGTIPDIFPGVGGHEIEVKPALGAIQHSRMGAGDLLAISSPPAEVVYAPRGPDTDRHLTMMLQADGATIVLQHQQQCKLGRGDICFVDELHPFRLVGAQNSRFLLLRMPRARVLAAFPELERRVATLLPGRDPGTALLGRTLLDLLNIAGDLGEAQQQAALNAIIHLLGATSGLSVALTDMHWRVRKALDFIECNLSTPGLTAEEVARAQAIGRRRLDQLMHQAIGLSVTAQIWSRRLQRAADELRDPRRMSASIAQIAFANGFEDPAHFARAFKRRFAVTPGLWRAQGWSRTH